MKIEVTLKDINAHCALLLSHLNVAPTLSECTLTVHLLVFYNTEKG